MGDFHAVSVVQWKQAHIGTLNSRRRSLAPSVETTRSFLHLAVSILLLSFRPGPHSIPALTLSRSRVLAHSGL